MLRYDHVPALQLAGDPAVPTVLVAAADAWAEGARAGVAPRRPHRETEHNADLLGCKAYGVLLVRLVDVVWSIAAKCFLREPTALPPAGGDARAGAVRAGDAAWASL